MALAKGNPTVLEFVNVQFVGDWTRWSGTQMVGYTLPRLQPRGNLAGDAPEMVV